jgi:hypothetical protein
MTAISWPPEYMRASKKLKADFNCIDKVVTQKLLLSSFPVINLLVNAFALILYQLPYSI